VLHSDPLPKLLIRQAELLHFITSIFLFQAKAAAHSKNFNLLQSLSYGVDQMQRNFEPMIKGVQLWQESQLTDAAARLIIYRAFIEAELEVPRHLARPVHDLYFNPQFDAFQPRTLWSLSNAFTSVFKELEPIPQFRATAKLAGFLQATGVGRAEIAC